MLLVLEPGFEIGVVEILDFERDSLECGRSGFDSNDTHAGGDGGGDASGRILEDNAVLRRRIEPARGF